MKYLNEIPRFYTWQLPNSSLLRLHAEQSMWIWYENNLTFPFPSHQAFQDSRNRRQCDLRPPDNVLGLSRPRYMQKPTWPLPRRILEPVLEHRGVENVVTQILPSIIAKSDIFRCHSALPPPAHVFWVVGGLQNSRGIVLLLPVTVHWGLASNILLLVAVAVGSGFEFVAGTRWGHADIQGEVVGGQLQLWYQGYDVGV